MVNNEAFKIGKIGKLNPFSNDYKIFWKGEKRKCIEGYWVGGKYMPPVTYYYVNHHIIELNKEEHSKVKTLANPFLRDLEWEKGRLLLEARGFSGFSDDPLHTCRHDYKDSELYWDFVDNKIVSINEINLSEDGRRYQKIQYMNPRDYLQKIHPKNLGKPLYENQAKNIIDIEARGCLSKGHQVLMYDGTLKKVENIVIGDRLMGKDSTPRTVQSLHSGTSPMYRIKSKRFKDIVVNENHLLSVQYVQFNRKGNKTLQKSFPIKELLEKQKTVSFTNRYYRYLPEQIKFSKKELFIDPYYLGLWLSDGRSNCTSIKITDSVLWKYLDSFAKENNIKCDISITKPFNNNKEAREFYYKDNQFREYFKSFNLINNKHIPNIYKTSSVEQRLQLLAGLIDGDGCYDKRHHNIDIYCGLRESLADDVVYLARSLGFYANKTIRDRKNYSRTYEVIISGDEIYTIPVKLKRKQVPKKHKRINVKRSSFHIEYEGIGEYYGFTLDGDHEYLLDDFTVDHNSGKSFFAAASICHNFLFDGATDYDELLALLKEGETSASETLIGAIDTKYSKNLIQKVKLSLDHMKGGIKFNGLYYPPPFLKAYSGSWESGKTIIAEYEEKIGGEWVTKGSRSKIHHRSFSDNPFAANGTRPGLTTLEEIGFFNNLTQALGQIKECTANGAYKFGTVWMFGTGGDMDGGSTEEAKKVFYDPEAYDCLVFNDEWENKGKIGYFVPATRGLIQFKDEEGNTNVDEALDYLMGERQKAANASDRKALEDELQQRPLKPSEAFLVLTGNIFPVADLKEHLGYVESHKAVKNIGNKGELRRDENGHVKWVNNESLLPCDYPVKEKDDKKGCIVVWEHPEEKFTPGLYIAGIDPYSQDDAPNSESLGSIIIYKRFLTDGKTYHWPVAEYTARPDTTNEFYENCRRLLEYYSATALYENQIKGLKQYFETKYCLHLLASQPSIIQEISPNSKVSRGYGIHMTKQIKQYAEVKLRDWLNEEYEEGKKNLTKIYSIPLLKELIAYNVDGNFDRVISMFLCILQDLEMFRIVSSENVEIEMDSFFNKKLFV